MEFYCCFPVMIYFRSFLFVRHWCALLNDFNLKQSHHLLNPIPPAALFSPLIHLLHFSFGVFFQEAMMKDTLERAREPNLNLKGFLQDAYIHPVFKKGDDSESDAASEDSDQGPNLVPTKRQSRRNTPLPSKHSGGSSSSLLPEAVQEHWQPSWWLRFSGIVHHNRKK